MDFVSLGFYAIICGLLGVAAPNMGPPAMRLGIGAAIGIIAAILLPMIRGLVTGY